MYTGEWGRGWQTVGKVVRDVCCDHDDHEHDDDLTVDSKICETRAERSKTLPVFYDDLFSLLRACILRANSSAVCVLIRCDKHNG